VNLLIFKNIFSIKLMHGISNIQKRNCIENRKQIGCKIVECPNYSPSKTPATEIDVNYCNSFRTSAHWNALQYPIFSLAEERGEQKLLVLSACMPFSVSHLVSISLTPAPLFFSASSPYLLHSTLPLDLRLMSYNTMFLSGIGFLPSLLTGNY
jgi:hypothetical protein